jgi:acyl-homoserine lactone acylase PvdQ
MPAAAQPRTIRSDCTANSNSNSNNNHELANLGQWLTGYSPIFGAEGSPQSLRASLGFDSWIGTLDGADPSTLYGASYLHAVTLGPSGPSALGRLPYRQSTEPASTRYLDQVAAWSTGRWFPFPFTEAQIAADPALTEIVLRY